MYLEHNHIWIYSLICLKYWILFFYTPSQDVENLAHHNFLSFLALKMFFHFIILQISCAAIHLHRSFSWQHDVFLGHSSLQDVFKIQNISTFPFWFWVQVSVIFSISFINFLLLTRSRSYLQQVVWVSNYPSPLFALLCVLEITIVILFQVEVLFSFPYFSLFPLCRFFVHFFFFSILTFWTENGIWNCLVTCTFLITFYSVVWFFFCSFYLLFFFILWFHYSIILQLFAITFFYSLFLYVYFLLYHSFFTIPNKTAVVIIILCM